MQHRYSFFQLKHCSQEWQYVSVRSEFVYYVLRKLNRTVPAYRTSVQFLKRTVPTYRTHIITKKAYHTSVPYFLAKIEAYRNAILAFNYSQLSLTLQSLAYISAISIHTFSVVFSCLLPLRTKSRRSVQKVKEFFNHCVFS